MLLGNKKIIGLLYIISMALIGVGVVAGAVYYSRCFGNSESVRNHLGLYCNSVKEGMDFWGIVKSSIKTYAIACVVVTLSSFMKLGPMVGGAVLIRKGFVNAFTTAALVSVYGIGGIALSLELLPQIFIVIPILCVYTAASTLYSKKRCELSKKEKIFYIIFSFFIFAIFCVSAFIEAFLTTTFMKWLVLKVT